MNAQEARKLSDKSASEDSMKFIMDKIVEAAKTGKKSVYSYSLLSIPQIRFLKEQGYEVTQDTDRDGVLVTISWENENETETEKGCPFDEPLQSL